MNGVNSQVVVFDGECNLCNSAVYFIVAHSPKNKFKFANMHSKFWQELIQREIFKINPQETVVFLDNNIAYTNSKAVLEIVRRLKFPWSVLYIFIYLPRPFRDYIYKIIVRNKLKFFGKTQTCWAEDILRSTDLFLN